VNSQIRASDYSTYSYFIQITQAENRGPENVLLFRKSKRNLFYGDVCSIDLATVGRKDSKNEEWVSKSLEKQK